jgi:hypothetical protein
LNTHAIHDQHSGFSISWCSKSHLTIAFRPAAAPMTPKAQVRPSKKRRGVRSGREFLMTCLTVGVGEAIHETRTRRGKGDERVSWELESINTTRLSVLRGHRRWKGAYNYMKKRKAQAGRWPDVQIFSQAIGRSRSFASLLYLPQSGKCTIAEAPWILA